MTTYNTGNAVGSTDPRDMSDNAQNFDRLSVGTEMEYPDRLGVPRKSWAGLEQQVADWLAAQGWEAVYVQYAADAVVQRPTQLVERDGELYRVALQSDLPLILGGAWEVDAPKLVSVGNQPLRQELASPEGASRIGRGSSTLEQSLQSIEESLSETLNSMAYAESSMPQLFDMHYGVLRGVGFSAGVEPGGVTGTTTTSSVSSGKTIPVANASFFSSNQLIVYEGVSGEYFSAVVLSVSGNIIVIRNDVEDQIAQGGRIYNFYANESHPTMYGYYAIADFALRSRKEKITLAARWLAGDHLEMIGDVTILDMSAVAYDNPGSSATPSKRIIVSAQFSGVKTSTYNLPAGQYVAKFRVTPNLVGSSNIADTSAFGVVEKFGSSETTIGSRQVGGNTPTVVEVPFFKRSGSSVSFRLLGTAANSMWIAVSEINIYRIEDNARSLDRGVHVLLGDSWFAQTGIADRLISRLPNATIINKGVGGDRLDQLASRFSADVVPFSPDFVWVMGGTNDVAQSISLDVAGYNLGFLNTRIQSIGATGLFFNASVGSYAHSALGDLLTRSREYASKLTYLGERAVLSSSSHDTFRTSFSITIPASSSRRAVVFPGLTINPAEISKLYIVGATGVVAGNVKIGYGGTASAAIAEDIQTFPIGTNILTNVAVPKSNGSGRFLMVEVQNTAATAIDVIGFVDANWVPQ